MIPLTGGADDAVAQLARITGSVDIAALDGATLLGERAMLAKLKIPGRTTSAGGGCRLYQALDDTVALNLARTTDRDLLPALLETEALDVSNDQAIAECIAGSHAGPLVHRGRSMGLAMASEHERVSAPGGLYTLLAKGTPTARVSDSPPKVLDLSALWAGPLAAHLLWLAGADVVKVESHRRPDAMREGEPAFHALLNQGKASVVLDFSDPADLRALRSLIATADIVIEASRPRALEQLGVDAEHCVRSSPGLVWVTLTGHGAQGESAGWIGFGDDCGVAAGLSAALRAASGRGGFVGDAIADPLSGISAALVAWDAWKSGCGGRFGVALSGVVAHFLAAERARDPIALERVLKQWSAAEGRPFGDVRHRDTGALAEFGADTRSRLASVASC